MKHLFTILTLSTIALGSAQAASYQAVVPEKSAITFNYKQMGVAMDGKFKKFNAQVSLDTAKLDKAKGSIDIDLASIDTGTLNSWGINDIQGYQCQTSADVPSGGSALRFGLAPLTVLPHLAPLGAPAPVHPL